MSTVTIPQAFALAFQHHQAGRLAEAEALYRQILGLQPDHAEALHFLGVIAHQAGRHDVAVDLIRQALVLNPTSPAAHSNLGDAYRLLGRSSEAIASFHRALQLNPDFAEALNNLGMALSTQCRCDDAIAAFRDAAPKWSLGAREDLARAFLCRSCAWRGGGGSVRAGTYPSPRSTASAIQGVFPSPQLGNKGN